MTNGLDIVEMRQGSQNLRAIQNESRAQYRQTPSLGYISDSQEIVKESWSIVHHDGEAGFELSGRSPLPPPVSAMDLPEGQTQSRNVHRIGKISSHSIDRVEQWAPETILAPDDCLNWIVVSDNPKDREDDCMVGD
jgi:hypothetical protein